MSAARIKVHGLAVFAYHGVLPEETKIGQRFVLDLDVDAEVGAAIADDDYEQAVCYASLSELAVRIATDRPFKLIETLADRIARAALDRFAAVSRVRVTVHKPGAPIPHTLDDVTVTIEHRRQRAVGFSLGSNLGPRDAQLRLALSLLGTAEGLTLDTVSSIVCTAPWGVVDQPDYLNCCAIGTTTLGAHALLRLCKEIELTLGRMAGLRWGPRAIDIDLLYLGETSVHDLVLALPHPRLSERAFVLVPLAEIAPNQKICGRRVQDMLNDVPRTPGDVNAYEADEED